MLDDPSEVLSEIELVTQEITEGKHYLIELDRRQNQYREARRHLLNNIPNEDLWLLCNGSTFVLSQIGNAGTVEFFDRKLKQGDGEIAAARDALKKKVAHLAQLEGPNSALAELYKGFDLQSSKKDELMWRRNFSSPSELTRVLNFMLSFDGSVRFHFSAQLHASSNRIDSTLTISTVKVPPFSYTRAQFRNSTHLTAEVDTSFYDQNAAKVQNHVQISWAINAAVMVAVLRGLHPHVPFCIEIPFHAPHVRVFQQEKGQYAHLFQVNCVYDLGPDLDIEVGELSYHRIEDVPGFCQLTRSLSACEHEFADVSVQFVPPFSSPDDEQGMRSLLISSDSFTASLSIGTGLRPEKELSGALRCQDILAFGSLLSENKSRDSRLFIGFGDQGLAALRLHWTSLEGERSVFLYFCS